MAQFFFSLVIHHHFTVTGSISHPKLCPPHTKRLFGPPGLPLFVLEEGEKVHIAHPVEETVMDIAVRKMKVHQENLDHSSLVWVGVLLGIRDFGSLVREVSVTTTWLSAYLLSTL
jgi:hypothetical protein